MWDFLGGVSGGGWWGFSFQRRQAEKRRGGWRDFKRMSIHLLYTESRDVRDGAEAGFTYPRRHSVTSIGTALLCTKSRTRGVDQFTSSNQSGNKKKGKGKKNINSPEAIFQKTKSRKKRKYTYTKCFIRLIKQHKNRYKKGRRALWSGTISLRLLRLTVVVGSFFSYSLKETDAGRRAQVRPPPPSGRSR